MDNPLSVGRVGGLAVALGIGVAISGGIATANADATNTTGRTSQSSSAQTTENTSSRDVRASGSKSSSSTSRTGSSEASGTVATKGNATQRDDTEGDDAEGDDVTTISSETDAPKSNSGIRSKPRATSNKEESVSDRTEDTEADDKEASAADDVSDSTETTSTTAAAPSRANASVTKADSAEVIRTASAKPSIADSVRAAVEDRTAGGAGAEAAAEPATATIALTSRTLTAQAATAVARKTTFSLADLIARILKALVGWMTPPPVTAPPPVTNPPPTSTPPGTGAGDPTGPGQPSTTPPLFIGDYSTGDFSQWDVIQNKYINSPPENYSPDYPARIIDDPVKGKVARYEVRTGDIPDFGGGERSEVSSNWETGGAEGDVRFYSFSTMFDKTFANSWSSVTWAVTNQWHAENHLDISPPIAFGYDGWSGNIGNWQLSVNTGPTTTAVWSTPLDVGNWHDIEVEIGWAHDPTRGYIRLWRNGVAQTLANGSTTWYGQTMANGSNGTYYKEGLYRSKTGQPTGIVYHTGFKAATSRASLAS